jgi:lipoprotein-anchoring transpeptidase ErfK/SrfK
MRSQQTEKTKSHAIFVPFLTMAVLLVLAVGARPGLANLGDFLDVHLTATPTKTPRPVTPQTGLVLVELTIVAPTSTPVPSPTMAPTAPPSTGALTPYLAQIVASYGMDTNRRFIVVDPDLQRMTIWDPGQPVRELPVSTGDESRGYRTPAWYGLVGDYWGTFHAFGVYADEGWYLYEDAGSILIHGAPYELKDSIKVYEQLDALGKYPASRGCIRLRPQDAKWFTQWQPKGVPIVVLPNRAAG